MSDPRFEGPEGIELHLGEHCIETTAKAVRARLERTILELDPDDEAMEDLASRFEVLTGFLERTDFKRLRAEHPELAGTEEVTVVVRGRSGGGFRVEVQGQDGEVESIDPEATD